MLLIWLCVFIGVLISQLIYVGANWLQYRRRDYASYFFYILALLLYFILLHQTEFPFGVKENEPNYVYHRFFLRPLAFAIYVLYFEFVIRFLETATNFNRLHRYIKIARNVFISFSLLFLVLNLFANDSSFADKLYHIFNIFIFAASLSLIISLWKISTTLSKFILKGAMAVAFGALLSNLLTVLYLMGKINPPDNYMLSVAIGVMIELYFFNSGLSYKSRQTELNMISSQKHLIEELEKSKALEFKLSNIRHKISRDLHDELGATLSGIAMFSYVTKIQLQNKELAAVNYSLDIMKENASEMVAKLNDIVWAVNPVQDNLYALLERLKEFALQLTSVKEIKLDFSFPDSVALLKLPMEYRRNIYLICKEAINNVVKYSEARLLEVKVKVSHNEIEIKIADNGRGFIVELTNKGNGLINMAKRADEINAKLEIDGETGIGTKITLCCKIT
ncbi:MAG: 7TM diverse intracellular signaling domain-containing protein [Bacteroidota bacterium]